ncbi:dTDP-4-dehydrorhamnose 3,5-epimerase [Acidocella sp.]|uniref:dTDP-4-dehydrorhamnose 3,5-epimerase n=1 Tax=Acidocella sp. TaxID=50710 RepID=UPI00262F8602|nr:dTDP-4-dehydrorhamnose 3,5-epimerase [Acidocella sp.]
MDITPLAIPDVKLIKPAKFGDSRGFFSETWNEEKLAAAGFAARFVQDNHSFSAAAGTIRGLHCQLAPSVQGKLVRVIKGAIWDVAVDVRKGSPSYGKWVSAEISEANWTQIWVPGGFLHGFCTIAPDTEVIYKVTAGYDKTAERAVIWNDPSLALPWPVAAGAAALSDKDRAAPPFNPHDDWFSYS